MLAFGAFTGGLVAAVFGAEAAFVADAFTFLLSAFFIYRVVAPPRPVEVVDASLPVRRFQFLDGFRYLLSEPFILGIALVKAAGSLAWGAINVLEITYANDLFTLTPPSWMRLSDPGTATLGLIYVVSGLGTGLGPLFMRRWLGDTPRRLVTGISIGFILLAIGIGWLSQAGALTGVLGATVVRTVGSGTMWVFSAAMLQTVVPDRFRGRVFSFEFAALTATQSISTLAAGYLVDAAGLSPQQAVGVSALTAVVVTVLWFRFTSLTGSGSARAMCPCAWCPKRKRPISARQRAFPGALMRTAGGSIGVFNPLQPDN